MNSIISKVVSVCSLKDIGTWIFASKQIRKFIRAERYEVIVPSQYIRIFESLSDTGWVVIDEEKFATEFSIDYVKKKMPNGKESRAGWYYQQLLKLHALINSGPDENRLLIWDADTVPLKPLQFFHGDKAVYFSGSEYHKPYFKTTKKLINLDKSVECSFIAQCFPAYSTWVQEFKHYVEVTHQKCWFDAILDCSDLSELSGFSEYETLGTFFVNRFKDQMVFNEKKWERFGASLAPVGEMVCAAVSEHLPSYVSYETWSVQSSRPKLSVKRVNNEEEFLDYFFNTVKLHRSITQVGANDGVMCDPISRYLTSPGYNDVTAILIEPVDFYFEKLKALHINRVGTVLIKAAASSVESVKDFYYIDPAIASEMNGDGPMNDWAHGQGSFYRDSIIHWIDENAFRGAWYRENMDRFKESILKSSVNCFPLKKILSCGQELSLLLVDVQGAELDVFLGVDWSAPPDFILYEQDIERVQMIDHLLSALGFAFMCGTTNVLLYNTKTISIVALPRKNGFLKWA